MNNASGNQPTPSALDEADPLKKYCAAFDLPEGVIYLDGNSLGPPPKAALARIDQTANIEWRRDLIKSWNKADWINLPKTAGAKIARLIGVPDDDVIVADSVSVNIFKLAAALLCEKPGAIAYEAGEFPTDGYILQGLARLTGAKLMALPPGDPGALCNNSISVFVKSAVHYKSAEIADIASWESYAAKSGVSIIWDLSHAAGLLDLSLANDGASFAVGCGYKYLNGGPGAPAFVFAARDKARSLAQPLSGWMGHAAPFDFSDDYKPADGAARFASGTPPILSLAALDAALDLFADISLTDIHKKAIALGDLFIEQTAALGFSLASPAAGALRGGHVCLQFDHGFEVVQALIDKGVIGDFRAPDLMRFGFSPLFLRYADIADAATIFTDIMKNETWRDEAYAIRGGVT